MIDISCGNTKTKSKIIVLYKSSENRSSEVYVFSSFESVDVQVIDCSLYKIINQEFE